MCLCIISEQLTGFNWGMMCENGIKFHSSSPLSCFSAVFGVMTVRSYFVIMWDAECIISGSACCCENAKSVMIISGMETVRTRENGAKL